MLTSIRPVDAACKSGAAGLHGDARIGSISKLRARRLFVRKLVFPTPPRRPFALACPPSCPHPRRLPALRLLRRRRESACPASGAHSRRGSKIPPARPQRGNRHCAGGGGDYRPERSNQATSTVPSCFPPELLLLGNPWLLRPVATTEARTISNACDRRCRARQLPGILLVLSDDQVVAKPRLPYRQSSARHHKPLSVPGPETSHADCGSECLGQFPLSVGFHSTELLPIAAWTLSPRAKMVFRRHVPPAQVPALKNSAFDLMTRSAFIAQVPAEPKQSTTRRDARRTGKSVGPLRPAVRLKTTTAPTLGPGHKLGAFADQNLNPIVAPVNP